MNVSLYKTSSPPNKINKDLGSALSFDGTLREGSSVLSPSILLATVNPAGYNYAFISQFGRYYYIDDIISARNGLWQVKMSVDVLMSHASDINRLQVILKSTESTGAINYMTGGVWQTNVKDTTSIINFPSGLQGNGEFILITAGG